MADNKKSELSQTTQTINDGLTALPTPRVKVVAIIAPSPVDEIKPTPIITSTSILSTRAE